VEMGHYYLHLRPGWEGRPRSVPPLIVIPLTALLSCFLIYLLLPLEPGQQVCFHKPPRLHHLPGRYVQHRGGWVDRAMGKDVFAVGRRARPGVDFGGRQSGGHGTAQKRRSGRAYLRRPGKIVKKRLSCAVMKNLDTHLWLARHISFVILNNGEVEPRPCFAYFA
jgi:hypothetical protein